MPTPVEYLRIFRARWWVFALAVLFAVVAVVATMPKSGHRERYQATRRILFNPDLPPSSSTADNKPGADRLKVAARFLRSPQLAAMVAEELDLPGDPAKLAEQVGIKVNQKIGGLEFTASADNKKRAKELADTFAEMAIVLHHDVENKAYQAESDRSQEQVSKLTSQLEEVNGAIGPDPAGGNTAQKSKREVLSNQLRLAIEHQTAVATKGPPVERFIAGPVSTPVVAPAAGEELRAPQSWWARTALAMAVALVVAAALILVVDRFDTRVRGKPAAERAFGLPVLAEVPPFSRSDAGALQTTADPTSPVAEAFHRLRTSLLLAPTVPRLVSVDSPVAVPVDEPATTSATSLDGAPRFRLEPPAVHRKTEVILVVSPGAGEGRTTVVANLAASLAEADHSVLVVDCDLRNPAVGHLLGVGNCEGVSDVVRQLTGASNFADLALPTTVSQVRVVTAGSAVASPGRLMERAREALQECRGRGDLVVVDTPAMLLFSDAIDLLPAADAVIVVAREGRTTADGVDRMVELLARYRVPVLGVVLNDVGVPPSWRRFARRSTTPPTVSARDMPVATVGEPR